MYFYRNSLKSNKSDELINTYLIRPVAGFIVWVLYYTPVTPNQVTFASTIAGLVAAFFYLKGTPEACLIAGLLITLKDVLDSADGQLARAKHQFSRIGRFLDSIGDFLVNLSVFCAIGWTLYRSTGDGWMMLLALLGLIGLSLRVSYHVFYQVNFLHLQNEYTYNRITEEVQEEDLKNGGLELVLQRFFQYIYGWQDLLMKQLDAWSRKKYADTHLLKLWYSDIRGLRISGFLGLGTELFLLMVCSVFNELKFYLFFNLIFMNGMLILGILYRRVILIKNLTYIK